LIGRDGVVQSLDKNTIRGYSEQLVVKRFRATGLIGPVPVRRSKRKEENEKNENENIGLAGRRRTFFLLFYCNPTAM